MRTSEALTVQQQFQRDGVLIREQALLPQETFTNLCADFERIHADWSSRFGRRAEEMDKPHFLYPELFDYASHPQVLDLVESLIGPDIVLFTTHFICKSAGDGQRVPWHTDAAYWQGMLTPMDDVLTIWLAIDPSTEENGCVRFVLGSHLQEDDGSAYVEVSDKEACVFPTELNKASSARAERDAVSAVLKPNQASIHHANTIHGSRGNASQQRRCGLTLRYFSSRCKWLYQDTLDPDFNVYLLRGRDHAGNHYAVPGVINEKWKQRLVIGS